MNSGFTAIAILGTALLAAPWLPSEAAAQQSQPLGPGVPQSCYQVQNAATFQILTHVILPSRHRSVARIDAGKSVRYCIAGALFEEGRVNFRVVSGLGPPLFSCMTKIDRVITVTAQKKPEGGWDYDANCR
jgi:hypothetical protein